MTMRNILVVNDDGIDAPGIAVLVRHAAKFGRVWVVAPEHQCSAMSQRIIITRELRVREWNLETLGMEDAESAMSLDGTPADCVRYALGAILEEKPDIVFSGINFGFNTGVDILYSGTVGAAMQALINGIPAIAFSLGFGAKNFDLVDAKIDGVIRELLAKEPMPDRIWNVNFPECSRGELQGILHGRIPDRNECTQEISYKSRVGDDGTEYLSVCPVNIGKMDEGSDKEAVMHGYISIGTVRNMIL